MSIRGPSQQCFGPDRHKTAGQERSERRGIAGCDLCEDRNTCLDRCEALVDQVPTMTETGPTRIEQFDRQFEPIDESPPDGDQPDIVGVDTDITAMRP